MGRPALSSESSSMCAGRLKIGVYMLTHLGAISICSVHAFAFLRGLCAHLFNHSIFVSKCRDSHIFPKTPHLNDRKPNTSWVNHSITHEQNTISISKLVSPHFTVLSSYGCWSLPKAFSLLLIFFIIFLSKVDLHTIKCTDLTCIIHWVLINTYTPITTIPIKI